MKLKVTFTEEQLIELVQATIKNKFPHENIEIGKSTINYAYKSSGNMDRDGRLVFKDIEVEVEFK